MTVQNCDRINEVEAVLVTGKRLGTSPLPGGRLVELRSATGLMRFHTRAPLPGDDFEELRVFGGTASVTEVSDDQGMDVPFLVGFRERRDFDFLACTPHTACPVPGIVQRTRTLIASIDNADLRAFLGEVFALPEVVFYYWTCPASLRDHHDKAGGLAAHSVQTAERVAAAVRDETVQRDLGIAGALIHDIGKIWSYDQGQLTVEASHLGHEVVGFWKLLPCMERLRLRWEKGAFSLMGMLWGRRNANGFPQVPAIARIVRAMDGFDADRDLAKRPDKTPREMWPDEIL